MPAVPFHRGLNDCIAARRPAVHALLLLEEASALVQRCRLEAPLRAKLAALITAALDVALWDRQLAPWVLPAAGGAVAFAVAELVPLHPSLMPAVANAEDASLQVGSKTMCPSGRCCHSGCPEQHRWSPLLLLLSALTVFIAAPLDLHNSLVLLLSVLSSSADPGINMKIAACSRAGPRHGRLQCT